MKVFVIYDKAGKIRGTFAPAHANVAVRPLLGHYIHTFERAGFDQADARSHLQELHHTYRVDASAGEVRLTASRKTK